MIESFEQMVAYNCGYDAGCKATEEKITKELYEMRGKVIEYQGKTYVITMAEIIYPNEQEEQ